MNNQTIVALATPLGRSGIGVIRLSGSRSLEITKQLVKDETFSPVPRYAALKNLYDINTAEIIDNAIITFFKASRSFTGEDVVEISCHGSPVLIRQILDFCLQLDARLAEPGEFSLRSLANGQMNLSQAEAIRDLIDAQTIFSARQAIRQLRGELSNQLQYLKDNLLNIIVVLESSIEFVEDDLPDIEIQQIKTKLAEIISEVDRLAKTYRAGKLLRGGIKVVLVGRPNVGKSSVFNRLVGSDRAIVTEIAGTTRDSISENLSIGGIPVSLFDTAGLRDTSELVESIGVGKSKQLMADADLILVVVDNSQNLTSEDEEILSDLADLNFLVIVNKIDLESNSKNNFDRFSNDKIVKVSAKSGHGFGDLEKYIVQPFLPNDLNENGFLVSDARHYDLLSRTKFELRQSLDLISKSANEEVVLIGLHNGLRFLGEITGETTTEDMLSRVFSTFCIGK